MRIVLTGAAGGLGRELTARLGSERLLALSRKELDVSDRRAVVDCVEAARPDVVVHQAAWTDVDGCEQDPERAHRVNAIGSRNVGEAAARYGSHLVYVSTDLVFDGSKTAPYHEWDEPRPLQVYGRSKLAGELACPPGSTIVRTSWLCGYHGYNMVKSVLSMASERDEFGFVADQTGSPTMSADLAGTVGTLIRERLPGTYHVANQGEASRYELARSVMELAGHDPDRVQPIALSDYRDAVAPRPMKTVLDNMALRLSGMDLLPPWRDSLSDLVHRLGRSQNRM